MTGPRFLSLYYTDCLPGQGLRGGAGFQFQALSVGVGQDAMTLVQRATLYEPPLAWMREQRAVADYPPSLAHVFDGCYVTARGIYLGAEANGVRQGNQFTHAVTTTDPEAYGQVRPAQFWDAPWWSDKPAPSTECDPIAAEPDVGPWGIDAVREWVLGQPDAQEWLTAVHSAFDRVHDSDRRRVLFVAEDPSIVLGWIVAGTLLLPQTRALRVGFRVFAANPRYSQHDVLAVHPDWAGPLGNPDRADEFVVFNLVTGRHSVIESTESALHWVPRFLGAGPDEVYDVVDAIELAQQFTRNRQAGADEVGADLRPSAADRLASRVVLLGDSPDSQDAPEVLAEWLADQPRLSLEDVAEPLVTALLDCRVDLDGLRTLDIAAHRHGLRPPLVGRVRLTLLATEIEKLAGGRTIPRRPDPPALPSYRWAPAEREEAARLIERAADQVAPERMDSLLRMATDFDVNPKVSRFRDGAARFVRWWADHPGEPVDPSGWRCGPVLVAALKHELASRYDRSNPNRLWVQIRQYWWPTLLSQLADPGEELDAVVASAAVEQGDSGTRRKTIAWVLGALRDADPSVRADLAWRALFRYSAPSLAELMNLLDSFPPHTMSKSVADQARGVLDDAVAWQLTEVELDAVHAFAEHGLLSEHEHLNHIVTQDTALQAWLASVADGRPADRTTLRTVSTEVLAARAPALMNALLGMKLPAATAVVEKGSAALFGLLVHQLPATWQDRAVSSPRSITAVALTYLITGMDRCPDILRNSFGRPLRAWVMQADQAAIHRVGQLLRTKDHDDAQQWYKDAAKQRRSSLGSDSAQQSDLPGKAKRQAGVEPAGKEGATKDASEPDAAKPRKFGIRFPVRRRKGE